MIVNLYNRVLSRDTINFNLNIGHKTIRIIDFYEWLCDFKRCTF